MPNPFKEEFGLQKFCLCINSAQSFLLSLPRKANPLDEKFEREATCAKKAQVQTEGKRIVKMVVNLINQKN